MDVSMDGEQGNPADQPGQQPASPGIQAADYFQQYYGQTSVKFKLKCIWLFLLGAVLSIVGLLCLLYRPDIGTNSFIIMLMGLFFTAIGSIYGKRKLAGQAATADYVVDPQQMLMVRPQPYPPYPQMQQAQQPLQTPVYQAQEQRPAQQPVPQEPRTPFFRNPFAPSQAEPVQATPAQPVQGQQAQPSQPEPANVIRKIFVCPSCGAENEMEDKFCYKCGFRFVKPKKKSKSAKAAKKAGPAKAKPSAKGKRAKAVTEPEEAAAPAAKGRKKPSQAIAARAR